MLGLYTVIFTDMIRKWEASIAGGKVLWVQLCPLEKGFKTGIPMCSSTIGPVCHKFALSILNNRMLDNVNASYTWYPHIINLWRKIPFDVLQWNRYYGMDETPTKSSIFLYIHCSVRICTLSSVLNNGLKTAVRSFCSLGWLPSICNLQFPGMTSEPRLCHVQNARSIRNGHLYTTKAR